MSARSVSEHDQTTKPLPGASATADLLYDAFYGAAIGGSVIALFFLVVDALAGQPLFTPSLIGTALFSSGEVSLNTPIRLDMVAYFSAVHFATFLALGGAISTMCRWTGLSQSNPVYVTIATFLILTGVFLLASALFMEGVGSVIGLGKILAANLLTGISMGWFLSYAHSKDPSDA